MLQQKIEDHKELQQKEDHYKNCCHDWLQTINYQILLQYKHHLALYHLKWIKLYNLFNGAVK